jgi:hypothetical protein
MASLKKVHVLVFTPAGLWVLVLVFDSLNKQIAKMHDTKCPLPQSSVWACCFAPCAVVCSCVQLCLFYQKIIILKLFCCMLWFPNSIFQLIRSWGFIPLPSSEHWVRWVSQSVHCFIWARTRVMLVKPCGRTAWFYAGHCTLARGQCLLGASRVPKQCLILSCVYVGEDEIRLLNYIPKPDLN